MKSYCKKIVSFILLVNLIVINIMCTNIYAESSNVYASTEKELYQYVNEFMKGNYKDLTIHIPKNEFKVDEYKEGICTHNTIEDVLTPLHLDTSGDYNKEYCTYRLYYYLGNGQIRAKALENKSNQIIKEIIKPDMTDNQKITAITEYINNHCIYVRDEYYEFVNDSKNNTLSTFELFKKYHYLASAYGVLCMGKSTCDGYSRAFNLLARKAGIPSIQVMRPGHAFNVYKIGNNYYEIDTTRKETEGRLITGEPNFKEKNIYKDLFKYVVLGTNNITMTPYNPYEYK